MHDSAIRIVTIDTVEGCRDHERLQNLIWGHDPPDAVPTHALVALGRHGGVVLGAYAGTELVGLLLSMLALHEGRLVHLSHLLGTHPTWRGRGIGEALKWRQRELVLEQGLTTTVIWTYDPLEAVNARLNLTRLGGIVRSYARDYYGAMQDALNRGIPSDRFTVEWHLDAPTVQERAAGHPPAPPDAAVPQALGSQSDAQGIRRPMAFAAAAPAVLVEIPAAMQALKRQAPDLALAWRLATRDAFERLFAAGYVATSVVRDGERVFYYLQHEGVSV
jgi:predicted GNAT superfamily acetyltransferase